MKQTIRNIALTEQRPALYRVDPEMKTCQPISRFRGRELRKTKPRQIYHCNQKENGWDPMTYKYQKIG